MRAKAKGGKAEVVVEADKHTHPQRHPHRKRLPKKLIPAQTRERFALFFSPFRTFGWSIFFCTCVLMDSISSGKPLLPQDMFLC